MVRFGENSGSWERAAAIASRYPVGTAVSVAYDPADPGTAVLEPGADRSSYATLGTGALMALTAPFLAIAAMQEWRESRRLL
ncbi:MAG: DUF3592 domain-containing protein [Anaerolineae bacterium]